MAPPPTCSGFLRKTFTPPGSNTKRGIWPKRWLSLKQIAGGGLALVWSPSEGAPPTGHLTITKKSLVSVPKSKQIRITTPGDTAPAGTLLLQAGSAEEHVRWLDAIDKALTWKPPLLSKASAVLAQPPVAHEPEPVARGLSEGSQRATDARTALSSRLGEGVANVLLFLAAYAALGLVCGAAYAYPESQGMVLSVALIACLGLIIWEAPTAYDETVGWFNPSHSNSFMQLLMWVLCIFFLPFAIIAFIFNMLLHAWPGLLALALGLLYVACGGIAHLMPSMLGDDPSPLLVGLATPPVIMGAVAIVAACVASSSRSGAAGADLV